jgi:hypothetical protein
MSPDASQTWHIIYRRNVTDACRRRPESRDAAGSQSHVIVCLKQIQLDLADQSNRRNPRCCLVILVVRCDSIRLKA